MKGFLAKLFLFICLLTVFLCKAGVALASADFETSQDVRYQVLPTGNVHVTQEVSLTNKLSKVYAKYYSLTLQAADIENVIANDSRGPMTVDIQKNEDQTLITLAFNEMVVGKGKTLNFSLAYDILDLAQK